MANRDEDQTPGSPFTPADRIRELVEIDQDVPLILRSAGEAIKTMAPDTSSEMRDFETQTRKKEFEMHTSNFLNTLQAISARLRRQVYALEEAEIIPPEDPSTLPKSLEEEARLLREQGVDERGETVSRAMAIENSGLGQLDVGYLNSRLDEVGKRKENDLWNQAREFAEKLAKDAEASQTDTGNGDMEDETTALDQG